MQDYSLEIKKCRDVVRLAEQTGNERLAETARGLIKSFKEWERDEFWD